MPPREATPDRGVGGRAAGGLDAGAHGRVQRLRSLGVDQLHRALDEILGSTRNASSAWAITSTMALPMASTSGTGADRTRPPSSLRHPWVASIPMPSSTRTGCRRRSCPSPLRPGAGPDLDAATFAGTVRHRRRRPRARRRDRAQRPRARDRRGLGRAAATARARRRRAPSTTEPTERAFLSLTEPLAPPAPGRRARPLPGRPQRQAHRLLPVDVHRRRRATSRSSPPTQMEATHRPQGVPVLGRARAEGRPSPSRLVVPEGLTALSNGAECRREPIEAGRRAASTFADTMPMSTYLVAFVVGPLEVTDRGRRAGGTPLRVAAPPGKSTSPPSPLEVAACAPAVVHRLLRHPVPGGKCDLVAVPDFAFGAMENHGCITFREVLLLVDPDRRHPARAP